MKPVLLEIEAFGPYSEPQVIDFTMLKDVNMFLIHGATGGGKTTILDAICYALYGDTSGNERDAESMRSHFAREDQLTQVKLTFKIKENTYFIHRIPGQERPKKVGTGFTYQNPEAELYRLDGEDKEFLASGVTKARDKVIELIGFDSDQFRQVIMIPQGQFRKLLVAKSEERQQILGEIFQTKKYKRVEDKIRDEERSLRNEVASLKERQKEQIKNIKYEKDTLLEELIQKQNIDSLQVIAEVENLCKAKEEELNQIGEAIKTSEDQIKKMSQQITTGKQNREKQQEKLKVERQYQELVEQEENYLAKEKQYQLAQKALPLGPVEAYIKDLEQQKGKNKKDILDTIEKVKDLTTKHKILQIQMDQCKNQEPETKKLEQTLHKAIEEYRPNVIALTTMEKEKKELQLKIKTITAKETTLQQERDLLTKEIIETEKALETRQGLNDLLRNQEREEIRLANILVQKKQLIQLENRLEKLLKEHGKAKSKADQSKEAYGKTSHTHNTLLQQWIQGQASVLAQNLQSDIPCPVCGSKAHPNPAQSTDETITEQQIKEAKEALDQANELYLAAHNEQVRIETEGKASRAQVEEQKKAMGEYGTVLLEIIQTAYNKIEQEKNKTTNQLTALAQLEEKLVGKKKNKGTLEDNGTKLQEESRGYKERLISLNTSIEKIKSEIPETLRNKEKLESYINQLEKEVRKFRDTYNKTQQAMEILVSQKIQAETMKNEKELQLEDVTKRYQNETKKFSLQMEKAGFGSFENYKAAYQPQEVLDTLDAQIKAYTKEKSALEAQFKQLEKETKDMILVNIEELEETHKEAEDQKDALARKHQTIVVEKQHNENQIEIILKSTQHIMDKEKRYSIVGNLYDAVRGKNGKGLSFERFIQSSLFEDILIRANQRLLLMSNNRYELYRSDNRETLASQSGLDMEVLDTYTGKKRHVRTLSGGEGFMASLSLALGLADVVQSYAGGISLDTIFIDEGFGTLDMESLDAAIKTLIDLQQSGRLVGIISHVPELKERIGARLEVVTTQKGSRAIFHI